MTRWIAFFLLILLPVGILAGDTDFVGVGSSTGDMQKSDYDSDDNLRVDDAESARQVDQDKDGNPEFAANGTVFGLDPAGISGLLINSKFFCQDGGDCQLNSGNLNMNGNELLNVPNGFNSGSEAPGTSTADAFCNEAKEKGAVYLHEPAGGLEVSYVCARPTIATPDKARWDRIGPEVETMRFHVIGNGTPQAETGTASGGTASTLEDTSKTWTTDEWAGFTVVTTGGTGEKQRREISSNTADTLTITPDWSVTPDGTTTYEIAEQCLNLTEGRALDMSVRADCTGVSQRMPITPDHTIVAARVTTVAAMGGSSSCAFTIVQGSPLGTVEIATLDVPESDASLGSGETVETALDVDSSSLNLNQIQLMGSTGIQCADGTACACASNKSFSLELDLVRRPPTP